MKLFSHTEQHHEIIHRSDGIIDPSAEVIGPFDEVSDHIDEISAHTRNAPTLESVSTRKVVAHISKHYKNSHYQMQLSY